MKISLIVLIFASAINANSATVIVDSFDVGDFEAGSDPGGDNPLTFFDEGLLDWRSLGGLHFPYWSATMSPGGGNLTIVSMERGEPARNYFTINYYMAPETTLSLLGNDAFRLRIPSLTGTAQVRVGWFLQDTLPVFLSEPGDLHIPLSYTGWPADQTEVGGMTIWIMPVQANFSIVLDEFALVPEPSAGALALPALLAAMRRRRQKIFP